MKLFLSILFVLSAFNKTDAQDLQLTILSSNAQENKTIELIGYSKSFKNYETLLLEIKRFKDRAYVQGYIEAKVQNITKNIAGTSIDVELGPRYESIDVYVDKTLLKLLEIKTIKSKGSLTYFNVKVSVLEELMNQFTNTLANKSYPFASVNLKNIKPIDKTRLKADLSISTKKAREFNKVEIKGYEKFPQSFIKYYLGIKTNIPFNLEAIQAKTEALDQISFAKQLKPAEVLFTQDSTSVYLYLEKNKSNRFDGFLGFGSEETTGNLNLNGYLNLNLTNNLNYGESFELNYRNDENDLKTFDTKLNIPYLIKTPIGSELSLNIFKKDSTFTTYDQSANLYYQLDSKQRLFVGIRSIKSNILTPDESSSNSDYRSNAYELSYTYIYRTPKDILFPVKSQIEIRLSIGNRKTSLIKTKQEMCLIKGFYLFELNRSNSIYIGGNYQDINSKEYFSNEFIRFGGIRTIRGFKENSINAISFGMLSSEYRYKLSQSLYVHSIIDAAYFNTPIKKNNKLVGIGFGFGIITQGGLLKFNIANGKAENQSFKFSDSKVHLSLTANF